MKTTRTLPLLGLFALAACQQAPQLSASAAAPAPAQSLTPAANPADLVARGEYLVRIAGCNDCHTAGYAESGGKVPKDQWLVGSPLGWSGPWGTTYATNLRLNLNDMDERSWLGYSAGLHTRPPMPDFTVRGMAEQDRLAIYRFVRSLGPAGEPAPAFLPPGQKPLAPYVQWVLPPRPAASAPGDKRG